MEDNGRVRRGYFVEALGAAQFVQPGVEERLRGERAARPEATALLLASSDPASPYGLSLPWPPASSRPMRAPGANVVIGGAGRPLAWLARKERSILTFFRESERERAEDARVVAATLTRTLEGGQRRAYLVARIDGEEAERTVLGRALVDVGFQPTARGLFRRAPRDTSPVPLGPTAPTAAAEEADEDDE
jgi:ATP-dependent Lhr-like helicase